MAVVGLIVVNPPAVEPISVDEINLHRRLDQNLEDGLIADLIRGARVYVETATQRALITQTLRLALDGFPSDAGGILLPRPRLQSVVSVNYVDTAGVSQTLATTAYQVDTMREPGWIVPAYGTVWPATRDQINAVEITYLAGYGDSGASVPADLRVAMNNLVGHWYEHRESVTVGQLRVQSLPMSQSTEMLLSAHWTGSYV